jgi:hypothetical protein
MIRLRNHGGNFVNADGTLDTSFSIYGPYSMGGNGIIEGCSLQWGDSLGAAISRGDLWGGDGTWSDGWLMPTAHFNQQST